MKTIRLKLRNEEDAVVAEIVGSFAAEELALLDRYRQHMHRVRETTLLTRGMPAITNFSWSAGAPMTFKCAEYSNAELHELLHVLRPLILETEPASFYKVQAVLGRAFRERTYAAHQKTIRRIFEDGELSLYMQISLGDQPLLDRALLRMWLNGEQYHTDAEKASAWAALEASLTTPNARAIVITQLQSRVKALMLLEHEANLVLESA